MGPSADPTEILKHQYELEKELRERTAKELADHDRQLSELYECRNKQEIRLSSLERTESDRKWFRRTVIACITGLVLKALWPLLVKLFQ